MLICKFCEKECKNKNSISSHERVCSNNPSRNYKNGMLGKQAWNKGLTKELDSRLSREGTGGKPHSEETKKKLSDIAKNRKFGGYRENAGRSKKYKVIDSFGNPATLQSSYEYRCFELLTELDIKWIRPKALKYNGRNYFADFYLTDYDIYIDPKNNYKAKLDSEKIRLTQEQNQVRIYVLLEKDLSKEYIAWLAQK